jgi:hypothetical protein
MTGRFEHFIGGRGRGSPRDDPEVDQRVSRVTSGRPSSLLIVDRSAQKALVESKKTLHGLQEQLFEARERLLVDRERLFASKERLFEAKVRLFVPRERLFDAKERLRANKVSTDRLRGRRFVR